MLRTRLVTALLLAPLILAIVFLGEPWLSLLIGFVAFLALVEVVGAARRRRLRAAAGPRHRRPAWRSTAAGLVSANEGGVGGVVTALLTALDPPGLVAATLVAAILLLAAVAFTRADPRAGFQTWATTTFGIAYIGLLLPAIVLVAHLAPPGGSWNTPVGAFGLGSGAAWALTLVLVVWGYDTGAYVTGRLIGRRRMLDHISPSKTIEGLPAASCWRRSRPASARCSSASSRGIR